MAGVIKKKRNKHSEAMQTYQWYKARGFCVACHHEYAEPGRVLCAACKAKRQKAHETKDPGNQQKKAYLNGRRADFIARGLCARCGRRPPLPGKLQCRKCLNYQAQFSVIYRIKQRTKKDKYDAEA